MRPISPACATFQVCLGSEQVHEEQVHWASVSCDAVPSPRVSQFPEEIKTLGDICSAQNRRTTLACGLSLRAFHLMLFHISQPTEAEVTSSKLSSKLSSLSQTFSSTVYRAKLCVSKYSSKAVNAVYEEGEVPPGVFVWIIVGVNMSWHNSVVTDTTVYPHRGNSRERARHRQMWLYSRWIAFISSKPRLIL